MKKQKRSWNGCVASLALVLIGATVGSGCESTESSAGGSGGSSRDAGGQGGSGGGSGGQSGSGGQGGVGGQAGSADAGRDGQPGDAIGDGGSGERAEASQPSGTCSTEDDCMFMETSPPMGDRRCGVCYLKARPPTGISPVPICNTAMPPCRCDMSGVCERREP